jgi:LPS export ABC transporter permease LptG/LPS export ABC transporter permease LptF
VFNFHPIPTSGRRNHDPPAAAHGWGGLPRMLKILDRYLIRETLLPFCLALLVLTFVLEIPPILEQGEQLIAKGVAWGTVGRVLLTLLPQALSITIPMAQLLGILVGFGRMSGDREFVAMQACGISLTRMLRPVLVLSFLGWAVSSYVLIVALPNANQTFREITFSVVASKAGSDVQPRVFFEDFPNRVIYIRDRLPDGGWRDVFLADSTKPSETTVYFAKQVHLIVDRDRRTVELMLTSGTSHTTRTDAPEEYQGTSFGSLLLSLDPDTVFPRVALLKGEPEMSIAELRESIADGVRRNQPTYNQRLMIQQKFSFPVACLVLSLLGLALGASSRKDGKLASFAIGLTVIFAYYLLLWTARSMAKGDLLPTQLAPWVPNIVLGALAVLLLARRSRSSDQPVRIALPVLRRWKPASSNDGTVLSSALTTHAPSRTVLVIRVPHLHLPRPKILDLYVSGQYFRIFALTFLGLLGLFYISSFVDLMERLIRGTATAGMLCQFFYFSTPQFVSYIVPISVLIASLVSIGLLTKNSELIVMRACGVSLYRSAVPLLVFALVASAFLFTLEETVLAEANQKAKALHRAMRGYAPQTFGALDRRWVVGRSGDIYHYELFDPRMNRFTRLSVYRMDEASWRLGSLTQADQVMLVQAPGTDGQPSQSWQARKGWQRDFVGGSGKSGETKANYRSFATLPLSLEAPSYFKTEDPDAERMTYGELKSYIDRLQSSGFNAVPYMVQLQRKVAFPFVTLVMTLLAVPFAVTTGRRGALYGIGTGIMLSIVYWVTLSIFAAIGASGLLPPALAAWAPNILFASVAVYMALIVRT